MSYQLYIILLSLTLLWPTASNAVSTSTNYILDGTRSVAGSGKAASQSYSNQGIVIGRPSAFSTYTGTSIKSSSYTFSTAPTTTRQLKFISAAPAVTSFIIGESYVLTVPVLSFTATGSTGLAGYMITESPATPSAGINGWSATVPTNYTFSSYGTKTLYSWVKDVAGNVSSPKTAAVAPAVPASLPVITVNSVPIPYYGKNITLSGTCSDTTGIYSVSVTNGTALPINATIGSGTWNANIYGLAQGTNTITVDAVNTLGKHSTSTINVVAILQNLTLADALKILHIANAGTTPKAVELDKYDLAPYVGGKSMPDGIINVGDAVVALQIIVGMLH